MHIFLTFLLVLFTILSEHFCGPFKMFSLKEKKRRFPTQFPNFMNLNLICDKKKETLSMVDGLNT